MARQARRSAQTPARPAGDPRPAPGVTYAEDTAAPGLKFFRCEPHRATLSMKGCASRWAEAQAATGQLAERMADCRSCVIGAAHAGAEHVHHSRLFGVMICPRDAGDRHTGGTMRMIGNRRCVSCYNREREMKAGRNARGNVPTELLERPLHTVRYHLQVNGRAKRARMHEVSGLPEAVLQTLRTIKGDVTFAFRGPDHTLRQPRLL
jgi:hypothetical protein